MKVLTAITLLFFTYLLHAQPPSGYYDAATGTGYTLKTQLHNIIDGHTNRSYGDMWDFIDDYEHDAYYEGDNSVLDIYSENPNGADEYNFTKVSNQCGNYSGEGSCYNREHSFPKSWFSDAAPMHDDAHHLFPTDGYVNGIRGNLPYGEVGSANYTSENGSKRGSARSGLGYSGTVFEPIDEFKGDLARAYFYMATRYEDQVANWSSDMLDGSSDQVFESWTVDMLLDWHTNDPVSQKEIDRNNNIYTYQGNRNPFIDNAQWVDEIWGDGSSAIATLSLSTTATLDFGVVAAGETSVSQSYSLSGSNLTDDVSIDVSAPFELSKNNAFWLLSITLLQSDVESATNNTIYVRFAPSTDNDQSYSQSISHTSAGATTINLDVIGTESGNSAGGSTGADDLFFSEYLEGSGNNKALEIFNGTGETINLSTYSIERYNNGLSSPSGVLNLSGSLADGEVYVIVNASADTGIKSEGDVESDISFFNGNDAIALYKNGVLVDLIGEIGVDVTWTNAGHSTAEQTLIRKSTIVKGNPGGFDPIAKLTDEWDSYTQDYADDLGQHTFTPPTPITWNGSQSTSWSVAANWDGGIVPTPSDSVLIPDVSSDIFPVISAEVVIEAIRLEDNASLKVTSGGALAILDKATGSGFQFERNLMGDLGYNAIGFTVDMLFGSYSANPSPSSTFLYAYNDGNYTAPQGLAHVGKGYFYAIDPADPVLTISGTPVTGNQTIAVEYTVEDSEDDFELVANPYNAAIDQQAFVTANNGVIDGVIYFWEDGGANLPNGKRDGIYVTVDAAGNAVGGTIDGMGYAHIRSGQGFFVRTIATGDVVYTPSMQTVTSGSNSDAGFFRETTQRLRLQLSNERHRDELLFTFDARGTLGHDLGLDAAKLINPALSIYSLLNDQEMAIQALPFVEDNRISVDLGLAAVEVGTYSLTVGELAGFGQEVILTDHLTGMSYSLHQGDKIDIHISALATNERFSISIGEKGVLATAFAHGLSVYGNRSDLTISQSQLDGTENVMIYTIEGKSVTQSKVNFTKGYGRMSTHLQPNQVYVLKVDNKTLKFVVE